MMSRDKLLPVIFDSDFRILGLYLSIYSLDKVKYNRVWGLGGDRRERWLGEKLGVARPEIVYLDDKCGWLDHKFGG